MTIPEEVLLISPASTSDEITGLEDEGLVARTSPPDSFQDQPCRGYLVEKAFRAAPRNTVNIGARNDAYGTGLADAFAAAWEEAGGTVGEEVIYDTKLPNYDTEAQQQMVSGNPDGLIVIDFPETYNKVGPALVRANFDPEATFVTDGLISDALADDAGDEAVVGLGAPLRASPTTRSHRRRSTSCSPSRT